MNPIQNPDSRLKVLVLVAFCCLSLPGLTQMVTGVWHGKINGQKAEVKIVQKGDSITGTSYYYTSANTYRRYSIKGYFDPVDNSVVWWDDRLIDNKGAAGKNPMLSIADFNCPGGGEMHLDGKAAPKEDRDNPKGNVALTKVGEHNFNDEWDEVIDNYTVGYNDPYIIDSVELIAFRPLPKPETIREKPSAPIPGVVAITKPAEPEAKPQPPATIEEKFVIRKKVFTAEIPIDADSIELRFFDNVQVDGDSITLFLNEKLIFTHIRLTEKPFTVKLAAKDLNDSNELTMVAENLGAIPPNTAYMVAIVGDKRYEINLSSTEETSGMIRLKKEHRTQNAENRIRN